MRKGSALLIVLGMLSFMVISAVAFSMYMRTSRQPSSYLRRSASSRHLLKAALANAIERIDGKWMSKRDLGLGDNPNSGFVEGVYDDPYPGIGPQPSVQQSQNLSGAKSDAQYCQCGNRWPHRVFTPFDSVSPDETVSTLTLEGLAYLPPAVINEARIYSRQTSTARWSTLTYESGRYAFCAIDVSDCFDVNKVRGGARTSAPNQRIGFSAMFPSGTSWSSLDTGAMSAFNAKANGVGDIPLVSLADYNLYFGAGQFSPFCSYIGKSGSTAILGSGDKVAASALYVTDTWFPSRAAQKTVGNATYDVKVLNLEATQPFDFKGAGESDSIKDVVLDRCNSNFSSDDSNGKNLINFALGEVGTICLYDYLDADSLPTTYCLPTVETVPMICGLSVKGSFAPNVSEGTAVQGKWDSGFVSKKADGTTEKLMNTIEARPVRLEWNASDIQVSGLAVFPFKRAKDKNYDTKFTPEVFLRLYIGSKEMNCRLSAPNTPLRSPGKDGDWTSSGKFAAGVYSSSVDVKGSLNFDTDIVKQGDTGNLVKHFTGKIDDVNVSQPLFWRVTKKVYTANDQATPTTTAYNSLDGVFEGNDAPVFYGAAGDSWTAAGGAASTVRGDGDHYAATMGKPDENGLWPEVSHPKMATAANSQDWIFGKLNDITYSPHIAVWARIKNSEQKTVDVVPAYIQDDHDLGNKDIDIQSAFIDACGGEHPVILDFKAQTEFRFADNASDGIVKLKGSDIPLQWTTAYVADPRYNYAPEAWYAMANGGGDKMADEQEWLDEVAKELGKDNRDTDIFMFTSDQEYLQSMGELQFLPWLQAFTDAGATVKVMGNFTADMPYNSSYQLNSGSMNERVGRLPGAWRTYRAEVNNKSVYDLGLAVNVVSGENDFRVNPFTQDRRVFMSVLANTPYDWFVASTNDAAPNKLGKCDPQKGEPKASEGLKHAFNSQSALSKLDDTRGDSELEDICDVLRDEFHAEAANWNGQVASWPRWEDVYDDMNWYDGKKGDEQKELFGVELSEPLHMVDRKFLHSFWRDCFQNRQQLFLVFIRAEPLTVGGTGRAVMASSQLGARGVALVWRDPEPPLKYRDQRMPRKDILKLNSWKAISAGGGKTPPPPHRTRVLFYHQFE